MFLSFNKYACSRFSKFGALLRKTRNAQIKCLQKLFYSHKKVQNFKTQKPEVVLFKTFGIAYGIRRYSYCLNPPPVSTDELG